MVLLKDRATIEIVGLLTAFTSQEKTMTTKIFTAIIHKEEDMYVAECLEVGTVDQGDTIEEAIANLKEATRLYLEEVSAPPDASPRFVTSFDLNYAETAKNIG